MKKFGTFPLRNPREGFGFCFLFLAGFIELDENNILGGLSLLTMSSRGWIEAVGTNVRRRAEDYCNDALGLEPRVWSKDRKESTGPPPR